MTGIIIRPTHIAAQRFEVSAPLQTHWERATCEDIDCAEYLNGWITVLPVGDPLILTLRASGRRFTEDQTADGLMRFTFPAGQECFRSSLHRAGIGRDPIYRWANREMRMQPRSITGTEWQERFEETLYGLHEERKEFGDG